jgi:hypothetical protein
MGYTFNDVEEAKSNFKPTLNPGIHEVVILGKELKEPEDPTKSSYFLVKFANIEGTREANIKFYINDVLKDGKTKTALDISLGNVKHIANNCNLNDTEKTRIKGVDKISLLDSMLTACIGKPYRQKFTGEEYIDKDNRVQVKVSIGFPNFAENINVPANESKLLFKSTDNYDYRRVPVPVAEEMSLPGFLSAKEESSAPKNDIDKLPF